MIGLWLQVWEQGTYKQLSTLMGHSGTVYALSALQTASGTKVFSASYDRSLRVSVRFLVFFLLFCILYTFVVPMGISDFFLLLV